MTTPHQRSQSARKLVFALAIGVLFGVIAHAQDFAVTFQHPTNSAPIKAYELYATDATNGWKGVEWATSATNKICFKSWNLPVNPCRLAIKSKGETGDSVLSESVTFDVLEYKKPTNAPPVPFNPVLPPTFLLIEKL